MSDLYGTIKQEVQDRLPKNPTINRIIERNVPAEYMADSFICLYIRDMMDAEEGRDMDSVLILRDKIRLRVKHLTETKP